MAYYQPYSNTHGTVEKLKSVYEPALKDSRVVGIAIGTRPDCFTEEVYDYLAERTLNFCLACDKDRG